MAAGDPAAAGFGRGIQQFGLVVGPQALQVRRDLLRTYFPHQSPLGIQQARLGTEQQQFVGLQFDGGAGRDVFAGQVEDLARRRVAQRRQQDDGALVEQAVDALAVDPAHFAGVVVVDAFQHADGPCGDQVARGHPQARALHRRGRHVHRQARLDGDAQLPDRVDHAFQRGRIGDAQAVMVMGTQATGFQAAFDLRAGTVDQHQAHPEAVQQHEVVDDIAEVGVLDPVPRKHDHESAVPVGIDVRRSMTQPIDVFGHNLSL